MWAVQVALACNNRDCKINLKISIFFLLFMLSEALLFLRWFSSTETHSAYNSVPPVLVKIRREILKTIVKSQLDNARKGVGMPLGRDKVGGRRWDRQERTECFSNTQLHLLEFKSDFSQWFVLLFAWTPGAAQLFDIYFISCVCPAI